MTPLTEWDLVGDHHVLLTHDHGQHLIDLHQVHDITLDYRSLGSPATRTLGLTDRLTFTTGPTASMTVYPAEDAHADLVDNLFSAIVTKVRGS